MLVESVADRKSVSAEDTNRFNLVLSLVRLVWSVVYVVAPVRRPWVQL